MAGKQGRFEEDGHAVEGLPGRGRSSGGHVVDTWRLRGTPFEVWRSRGGRVACTRQPHDDHPAAACLQRCGERRLLLLRVRHAGAAEPHDLLALAVGVVLLRHDRVLVPRDLPPAVPLLDQQRQDVRHDEHDALERRRGGAHSVAHAALELDGVGGGGRREPLDRRERRRRRRRQHVQLVAHRERRPVRREDAVALKVLPALEAAVGDEDVLVLDGRAREHRDGRPRAPRLRLELQRHALGRVPAAERRVVAHDAHRRVRGAARDVHALEVDEHEGRLRVPELGLRHRGKRSRPERGERGASCAESSLRDGPHDDDRERRTKWIGRASLVIKSRTANLWKKSELSCLGS